VTRAADRVLLDTNVLLAATDTGRPAHDRALATLNEWPAEGIALYTSGQILREYLVVATRPVADSGLGMSRPDGLRNVRSLRERLAFLDETAKVSDRLLALLDDVECSGKQVHDANVVATMLTHGIAGVVTFNADDFARFGRIVQVIEP